MTTAEMNQSTQSHRDTTSNGASRPDFEVVIVGAGPYGLSAAAYLKGAGLDVCVIGEPMEFWANKMPPGMLLRSPRAASNIGAPRSRLTLENFESDAGIRPVKRVALETFVGYGRWFEKHLGSIVRRDLVSLASRENSGFRLQLASGDSLTSRFLVVATGVGCFQRKPRVFASLDASRVSHCYEGKRFEDYPGRRVAVIGAGQSALESAALLHENGADVEVICRIGQLRWIGMHPRLHQLGPISKMLYSPYDVGPAGISRLVSMPKVMHRVPLKTRDKIRKRAVRSAGAPWLIQRLEQVKISTGRSIRSAQAENGEIRLALDDGSERRIDHILLGTGYDVDIAKYSFLSRDLINDVQVFDGYPKLDSGFRCSVPGLYFLGAPAARSFGPLMYFVAGTEFVSRILTSSITGKRPTVRA